MENFQNQTPETYFDPKDLEEIKEAQQRLKEEIRQKESEFQGRIKRNSKSSFTKGLITGGLAIAIAGTAVMNPHLFTNKSPVNEVSSALNSQQVQAKDIKTAETGHFKVVKAEHKFQTLKGQINNVINNSGLINDIIKLKALEKVMKANMPLEAYQNTYNKMVFLTDTAEQNYMNIAAFSKLSETMNPTLNPQEIKLISDTINQQADEMAKEMIDSGKYQTYQSIVKDYMETFKNVEYVKENVLNKIGKIAEENKDVSLIESNFKQTKENINNNLEIVQETFKQLNNLQKADKASSGPIIPGR